MARRWRANAGSRERADDRRNARIGVRDSAQALDRAGRWTLPVSCRSRRPASRRSRSWFGRLRVRGRSRTGACFALAEQSSEEAAPVQLVLVRSGHPRAARGRRRPAALRRARLPAPHRRHRHARLPALLRRAAGYASRCPRHHVDDRDEARRPRPAVAHRTGLRERLSTPALVDRGEELHGSFLGPHPGFAAADVRAAPESIAASGPTAFGCPRRRECQTPIQVKPLAGRRLPDRSTWCQLPWR
jgi:hypothetical protein